MTAKTGARAGAPPIPVASSFSARRATLPRLLVPALYNLAAARLAAGGLRTDRRCAQSVIKRSFRADLAKSLPQFANRSIDQNVLNQVLGCVAYVQGDPDDEVDLREYRTGAARDRTRACHTGQSAVLSGNTAGGVRSDRLSSRPIGFGAEENGSWRRVIIEKPFGTDLASAHALNQKLLGVLKEHQIFRIDHYLGKETVQNIMVLRFANGLFEPIWNRDHIDHVQITVAESLTVGRRGNYYDATGALRDMVPNHLIQLLSLIAMEPPSRFAADAVRAEKAQVLDAVQLPNRDEALAQFGARRNTTMALSKTSASRPTARPRTSTRTARPKPMSRSG